VAAERLRWEGFEVVSIVPTTDSYPRTQIVDFTTTSKGSATPLLMRLYWRYYSDVILQPTEERTVDYRIILGSDYDPCNAISASYWMPDGSLPTPTPLPAAIPLPGNSP